MAAQLDLLGVLVLASITAVGGGTLRDVLLGRHPIFWIKDSGPIYTIMAATTVTLIWVHFLPIPTDALLIADALGLADMGVVQLGWPTPWRKGRRHVENVALTTWPEVSA